MVQSSSGRYRDSPIYSDNFKITVYHIFSNGIWVAHRLELLTSVHSLWPASAAQLDTHLTSVQEVGGSIPARSATFFRGDLIMKYFLRSFSLSADSRRAFVSIWQKNVHTTG